MYSVLLIDDEPWVMEDLKTLINWTDLGFEIVAEANNAEDAKLALSATKPDLVISDIRMPELSGIQLLETCRQNGMQFKVIFVTAYGKFEYAKKALELGAFGYLLKPVEPDELTQTLKRAKLQLDNEAGVNEQIHHFERTKLLYSLIDSYNADQDLQEKMGRIGITNLENPFVLVLMKTAQPIQENTLHLEHWNHVFLPVSHNKSLLFVQSKTDRFNVVSYKNLIVKLKKYSEQKDVYFGVSRVMRQIRKFRAGFMQAENALDTAFINKQKVNMYRDSTDQVKEVNAFIAGFKATHSINELLNQLPSVLIQNKINIENLIPIVSYLTLQIGVDAESAEIDSRELINQFPNIESYFSYLYQCINESHKKGSGKTTSRYVIKEITDYIKYNYNQKLMINDLAQKFFLNPSYLSNLFKVETGKSFTSFLVECRLKKAVELLENTNLSLYEISSQVGYDDYFHFSKLFKKYMDISPANYRKSKANKETNQ